MIEAIDVYGNPSSRHAMGIEARRLIDRAREQVGAALGVARPNPENFIFTSCGSEADNWAIKGVAYALAEKGKHIILSNFDIS